MASRSEKARAAILKVLNEATTPMGASRIASGLLALGVALQPRTIRLHLLELDHMRYTRLVTRRAGRIITETGRRELASTNVMDKVGMVAARVDALGFQMGLRHDTGKGTIILNVCLIEADDLTRALTEMEPVFSRGLAMGARLIVRKGGETLAGTRVPRNSLALGTVCSVTLNGILLHEGIPVISRFGGLLEMRDRRPVRFVEAIDYRGSSLDPFEVFIKADMTRVRNVVQTGSGIVCASFREIPSVAVDKVYRVEQAARSHGLGGFLAIGKPNQPFLDIPVLEGYSGMVVVGGLNPIAAVHEAGVSISIQSLAGLQEFDTLEPISRIKRGLHSVTP